MAPKAEYGLEGLLNKTCKNLAIASLLLGVLTAFAAPAIGEGWRWSPKERRWSHGPGLRSTSRDLTEAKRQLQYDRTHGASRRKIAEDERRVRAIEADIRATRRK